jgi:multidrug efflux pump subunit AcrB
LVPNPIGVAVQGLNLADRAFAEEIRVQLQKVSSLRDLEYAQPLDYPTVNVNINRDRAGQMGVTVASVARSLVAATSSSRFTEPNFWRDPASGNGFQIQVEIPQSRMASIQDIQNLPVLAGNSQTLLGDLAEVKDGTTAGEIDRYNGQRVVESHRKYSRQDSQRGRGRCEGGDQACGRTQGVTVSLRGQVPPLEETVSGLQIGLLLSIAVIFLLLAANFQSIRLAFAVISTVPGCNLRRNHHVVITGTTLNVQSFMGPSWPSGWLSPIPSVHYFRRVKPPTGKSALMQPSTADGAVFARF